MRTASDIAAWWEEQRKASASALDEFVDDHPNWFGVFVAGTTATAMEVGAGVVDVLRLGEGVAEGGPAGAARDGLRLLQAAPAAGKLGRSALARFMLDPDPYSGICTWVSAAKALRHVGARAFASVDDLAQAAGFASLRQLSPQFVDVMVPLLKRLGARVTSIATPKTLEAVNAAVPKEGVVLFSVRWGPDAGHTIYAFRDIAGRVKYADRNGAIVSTLRELERFQQYRGIASGTIYGSAAVVEGPRVLIADGVAVLAMEVRSQLAADPVTVAQAFEVKKAMQGSSAADGSVKRHVVQSGDNLSKLAKHYYGDMFKWPVLYEANRAVVGRNPNLIHPGQKLVVPALPSVSASRRR